MAGLVSAAAAIGMSAFRIVHRLIVNSTNAWAKPDPSRTKFSKTQTSSRICLGLAWPDFAEFGFGLDK